MASKIIFAPTNADEIVDLARSMTPPGFELVVVEVGTPKFYDQAADAEYYLGLSRGIGGEFFRSAPKLKLVQLMSAGYDRVDIDVQYYDVARLTEDQEDALGVRFVLFDELLRTSDVVSMHVPLDDKTRAMISARELGMMKPTAIIVNTCRGPVIDEDALYKALTTGQIGAAGLDVMVEEPPKKDHPLFKLPNVTLTPHSAGPTWENWTARLRNGFDNIQRVANGRAPKWVIPELQA